MNKQNLDQHFIKNTASITIPELFWGFGLPVLVDSTFLQLFLSRAGATNFIIGLVPTVMFVCLSIFPLISEYFTSRLKYKRNTVIWLHIVPSLSIIAYGMLVITISDQINLIGTFLVCYALFAAGIGLCMPVWMNFLVKIFTEAQNVKALSIMMIFQNITKIIGSIGIAFVVENYAFDLTMSGVLFTLTGVAFLLGSFGFFLSKEPADRVLPKRIPFWTHITKSLKQVTSDRNFLMFLSNDLEFFAVTGVLAFYAIYATKYCGISSSIAAGLFVGFAFVGSIVSNIIFGYFNVFSLKNKCLFSKVTTLLSLMLLIFYPTLVGFLMASILLGSARNMKILVFPPAVKKISGLEDTTAYFAVSALITLPFSSGISMLTGKFLDLFSHWGADAYRVTYLTMAVIVIISLLFVSRVKMD